VITGDAEQRQTGADLLFEDLEQPPHDTRPPSRGKPIDISRPTETTSAPRINAFTIKFTI
jgi:hypothetical protein